MFPAVQSSRFPMQLLCFDTYGFTNYTKFTRVDNNMSIFNYVELSGRTYVIMTDLLPITKNILKESLGISLGVLPEQKYGL